MVEPLRGSGRRRSGVGRFRTAGDCQAAVVLRRTAWCRAHGERTSRLSRPMSGKARWGARREDFARGKRTVRPLLPCAHRGGAPRGRREACANCRRRAASSDTPVTAQENTACSPTPVAVRRRECGQRSRATSHRQAALRRRENAVNLHSALTPRKRVNAEKKKGRKN